MTTTGKATENVRKNNGGSGRGSRSSSATARSTSARSGSARSAHRTSGGAAQRRNSKNNAPHSKQALIAIAAVIVVVVIVTNIVSCVAGKTATNTGFPSAVEQWRPTVETACADCSLDTKWVDTILAMIEAESSGNEDVSSVVGCVHDIMQAGEGCAGVTAGEKNVVQLGSQALEAWGVTPSQGFDGDTATSSIYAGVLETKQNVELFEGWLGEIDVNKPRKVALIAQGYNYGADGWFSYCKKNKIKKWTLKASSRYQKVQAGGTVNHGQKVMDFYAKGRVTEG